MSILKGACVVGQSGGPTAVINASAEGVIATALKSEAITRVLAMKNGILGLLNDRLFDCSKETTEDIELLKYTPSSALGSCRYKLKEYTEDETDYIKILEVFKKYDIRYLFYIGGNDSMDTCNKVSKYMEYIGYECRIIGIPKTVDNDLYGTDHCPGYPSAAKYIATTISEISRDNKVYDSKSVVIVEAMGRNAGWLAASAALASEISEGPDFIYLPEVVFSLEDFLDNIISLYNKKKSIIVVVSEGIRDKNGRFISEYSSDLAQQKDAFGHSQMGGLAATLAGFVKEKTGLKTRGIELSLLQRAATHIASKTDIEEAYMVGLDAVYYAIEGRSDVMVALERKEGDDYQSYQSYTVLQNLSNVANKEQTIPLEWINEEGNNVTDDFIRYALPLIFGEVQYPTVNGLPKYANLKKII